MEQLGMILKEQITLSEQLLELSKLQTQELVVGNAMEVQKIAQKIEIIMKQFLLLENKRQTTINEIRQQYKISDNVNLVKLIELLNPKSKDLLLDLIRSLEQVLDELRFYIQQNKILTKKAMNFINFNINVITSTSTSTTYAPRGQEGSAIRKKKMFDQSI